MTAASADRIHARCVRPPLPASYAGAHPEGVAVERMEAPEVEVER